MFMPTPYLEYDQFHMDEMELGTTLYNNIQKEGLYENPNESYESASGRSQ